MKKIVSLLFLVLIPLAVPIALFLVNHQTQYGQQAPNLTARNVYYASPGDNLAQKVSVLQPGDTLLLNDGVYYSPLYIENKQGTATAWITIKAVTDGKAIIDGSQITHHYTPTVFLGNGTAYINVEGIVARNNPYDSVVYVYGTAHDITLRRISASNAPAGNFHIFNIAFGPTDVLIEDCAGWGQGRYIFLAYHASNVTFRRDWAYQPYTTQFSPAPRSAFGVYGASNVTLENVIGINAIPNQMDDNYYTGVWQTTDDTTNYPNDNTTYLGSIFYNNCQGLVLNETAGQNTKIKDTYFENPTVAACQQYTDRTYGIGLSWGGAYGGAITNSTFVNNAIGYNTQGKGPPVTNSVFLNNRIDINQDTGHSYLDSFGNTSLGTSLNATDKRVNPGYDTTTYGKGAYLFIPQNSPLKGTGQNGADIGANILYEYVDGKLTNQRLWPWPMEDRIMAETGISVTWEANGGIWKTLSGVYPNMRATASPTPILPLLC